MMHGDSARSLPVVLDAVRQVIGEGAEPLQLGNDLLALDEVVDSEPPLRRTLTEPAIVAEAKDNLLRGLFADRVGDGALKVFQVAASRRWSHGHELAEALAHAGVAAIVARAEAEGHLEALEDELFRFQRILEAHPELVSALSDKTAPLQARRRLAKDLLQDKVTESTSLLVNQAVTVRHNSLIPMLIRYQEIAAEHRDRLVGTVWVAAALSEEQKQRLADGLARSYGREIHLNVIVDPAVLGGIRVAIGDEIIDSTIQTRLNQAKRRVA